MSFINFIFSVNLMFFLIALLTKNNSFLKEKFTPFECGFDPFSMSHLPFSLRFYMITIIFLIFDIGIIILLPLPIITNLSHKCYPLAFFIIIFLIFIGLMHVYEWNKGMTEWLK